jgi:hypothetical protein
MKNNSKVERGRKKRKKEIKRKAEDVKKDVNC